MGFRVMLSTGDLRVGMIAFESLPRILEFKLSDVAFCTRHHTQDSALHGFHNYEPNMLEAKESICLLLGGLQVYNNRVMDKKGPSSNCLVVQRVLSYLCVCCVHY
jgi:hypothetical protein